MDDETRNESIAAVAVSNAGGQARHFRVQYRRNTGDGWLRYASFDAAEPARSCLRQLTDRGYAARLVRFAIAPAAG